MSYNRVDGDVLIYESGELRGLGLAAWHLHDLLWHAPGMTAFGIRRWRPVEALAWSQRLDLSQVEAALSELEQAGAAHYDPGTLQLFVRAKMKQDPVDGPKSAKGAVDQLLKLRPSTVQIPAAYQLIKRLERLKAKCVDHSLKAVLDMRRRLLEHIAHLMEQAEPDTLSAYAWCLEGLEGLGIKLHMPERVSKPEPGPDTPVGQNTGRDRVSGLKTSPDRVSGLKTRPDTLSRVECHPGSSLPSHPIPKTPLKAPPPRDGPTQPGGQEAVKGKEQEGLTPRGGSDAGG